MFKSLFVMVVFTTISLANASSIENFKQTLEIISNRFESSYAFPELKDDLFNWKLPAQKKYVLKKALRLGDQLTNAQAQSLLNEFVFSTRDYHAQLFFDKRSYDSLPFVLGGVNKVYIAETLDPSALKAGDQVLSWDGEKIKKVLKNFYRRPEIEKQTDKLYSFFKLTNRYHLLLDPPAKNDYVELTVKRDNQIIHVRTPWNKHSKQQHESMKSRPWWHELGMASNDFTVKVEDNRSMHFPNAPKSAIKPLGKVIWRTSTDDLFDSWITIEKQKRIALIRINTFSPANNLEGFKKYVDRFEEIVKVVNQYKVDALVLDLRNNFGGSIDYAYALSSFFVNKEVQTFDFEYRLFPELKNDIFTLVEALKKITNLEEAYAFFGSESYYGYTIDMRFVGDVLDFYQGLADDINSNQKFSKARPYNASSIKPHPNTQYQGKLFITANAWSISCGDFFPAFFKHHKRALLLGEKTAGAGGFIGSGFAPSENKLGLTRIRPTFAAGRYPHGGEYLENNGPVPDIEIKETDDDFKKSHHPFSQKIFNAVLENI